MQKLVKASFAVLAVMLLALAVMACPSGAKMAKAEGTAELWSFTDELKKPIADYEAQNPKAKINLTITPTNEFVARIQPVLLSGTGAPDSFTGESAFFRTFIESEYWENISAKPYNADALVKDKMTPYAYNLSKDSKGNLKALTWQSTAGAFIVRRDIAKDVLGTDDPAEVSKYTNNWKGFWELAGKIKEQSAGKKFMLAQVSDELLRIVYAGRNGAWVKDGKFNLDKGVVDFFADAKMARDNGYDARYAQWSGEWAASMANGDVFGYVLPTWGLHYVLKPNAGEAGVGKYELVAPPANYFWGGTWVGIYPKGTPAGKAISWDFIKMFCIDDTYMEKYAKDTGDFLCNQTVVNKIKDDALFNNPFLAGQNHYAYFYEAAKQIKVVEPTGYDQTIEQSIQNRLNEYLTGTTASVDEAVKLIKEDVKTAYPDVKVD